VQPNPWRWYQAQQLNAAVFVMRRALARSSVVDVVIGKRHLSGRAAHGGGPVIRSPSKACGLVTS